MEDNYHNKTWCTHGIYGWPERANKFRTWELMRSLIGAEDIPYVFFGDFNEILRGEEKEGETVRHEPDMAAFRRCLEDCNVVDLGFRGSFYTLSRGNSPSTMIRERLDRFLATPCWVDLFPNINVRHFPIYKFDHAPILLNSSMPGREEYNEKLFKFESYWLTNDECRQVVSSS